jgi:hypothetical protein
MNRRTVAALGLLAVAACTPSPEDVVTETRHCGGVQLPRGLLMRLSSYSADQLWVVQACHRTGTGCAPILTYRHSLPPAFSVAKDGTVTIELLGGFVSEIHRDEIQMGPDRRYDVVVRHITGNVGEEGLNRFRARIGFPPGQLTKDVCTLHRELNPDPSR